MSTHRNRRILVVDDMPAIHDDFRKILAPQAAPEELADMEAALFGTPSDAPAAAFEIDSAHQGDEALAMVAAAVAADRPYAMAFVDMRMPPGWDGVETIEHLWRADERLQVVICTAYSDHSWESVLSRLDMGDRLLILKKPFDAIEVAQLARALTAKRERNDELLATMAELRQATHDAQQASRAKSEFVATISHELRTPMNGVIGAIGLLESSELSGQQRALLGVAGASAGALLQIVDDILDFSRLEAGRLALAREPLSIAGVVARACAMVAAAAGAEGVALSSHIDPHAPPAIWGDATRLRQLLVHLLGNAIKFSSRDGGSKQVALRARSVAGAGGSLCLELAVQDDGIGMDADTVAGLFQPFSQADSTSTRRYGGTGLGLAISKRLVESMGGTIAVVSAPLAGSTFTVRLPVEAAPASSFPAELEPTPSPSRPVAAMVAAPVGTAAEAPLVLVAEDHPVNQRIVAAQLQLIGFRAEVAADGREALARLRQGSVAVLITDLQMPVMDGYALAESIRREPGPLGRLPIVALTANALPGESERCIAAGMNDYLTKPVELAMLEAVLWRCLRGGEAALAAAPSAAVTTVDAVEAPVAAPPSPAHDDPVDPRVLADIVGPDSSDLGELFRLFSRSGEDTGRTLQEAVKAGQLGAVLSDAHRLRGSARSIGASRLGDRCQDIEDAARQADAEALSTSLARLLDELAAVRAWIDEHHAEAT